MIRRIFIIRHGNTFGPDETSRRIGAATDLPLVDSGLLQAKRLGEWFSNAAVAVSHIWSSPLLRARQTASTIAQSLNIVVDGSLSWLNEIDHGPDENKEEAEVLSRIGDVNLRLWEEKGIAPPDWNVDREKRLAAWRTFFEAQRDGIDLLVTSNGAARFALLTLNHPLVPLKLRTGAFGEIVIDRSGPQVVQWDVRP